MLRLVWKNVWKGLGNMNAYDEKLVELRNEIENQIHHSYLEKFIQQPVIDTDKLFILSTIIQNTTLSDVKKKTYIITTMLVQIALDTHDLVTENKRHESDQRQKYRQLTVLAGDYFSGLYYSMLAKIDDVSMIHTLATAIKEVNEQKMKIYYKEFVTVDAFIDELKQLESLLIKRVARSLLQSSADVFIENWLLTLRLVKEKTMYEQSGDSTIVYLLTKGPAHNVSQDQILFEMDKHIQKHLAATEDSLDSLPTQFQIIRQYVDNIKANNFDKNTFVMGEG
ncbi:heptaprenyl diphosphate synthase component 1 [Aquibacillus sediminis]|uniref:heptaprenyl diphosphate synthase component 1 n=1 Tax=Aquibacillus sediminis TaxID=2574734 RepID=UPI001108C7ED|nr:heptaprenyl diphosphate synthase component 1 [Aquibacillus sediminis]